MPMAHEACPATTRGFSLFLLEINGAPLWQPFVPTRRIEISDLSCIHDNATNANNRVAHTMENSNVTSRKVLVTGNLKKKCIASRTNAGSYSRAKKGRKQ